MLDTEEKHTYLIRRRAVRDYLERLPDEIVNLDNFVSEEGRIDAVQSVEDAVSCGAVCCMGGWIWTMPAYRAWHAEKHPALNSRNANSVREWLGIEHMWAYHSTMLPFPFGIRDCNPVDDRRVSDKMQALTRIAYLIQEAS